MGIKWFILPALVAVALASQALAVSARIMVSAGGWDRHETPVEVQFQRPLGAGRWELVDRSGAIRALQMLDDQHGVFILDDLKANQTRAYTLRARRGGERLPAAVTATRQGGKIVVTIGGKTAFVYQGDKTPLPSGYAAAYQRGGYIYPVLTPSGRNVADDYPPNHKHQHGIWSAWTKTLFQGRHPDFWNMGDRTGSVESVDFGHEFSGVVCGGFAARHRYVDLSIRLPVEALDEQWQALAYNIGIHSMPLCFVFDLTVTQTCAGPSPLTLEQYRYGGVAFRGARGWNGRNGCQWLTSGRLDRIAGNESRSRWVRVSGQVDGRPASVAIFDSPLDFRFPQPIRIFPDQPYCVYAPSQLGAFQIAPGKPFVEHYRFVVADRVLDREELDRMWNDYAHPPLSEVK